MPSPKGGGILLSRVAPQDIRSREKCIAWNLSFSIFVDAIFTTLLEALFTNAFDVMVRLQARACVLRARRCD